MVLGRGIPGGNCGALGMGLGSSGMPVSGNTAAANECAPTDGVGGIGNTTIASLFSPEGSCQDASACY